MTISSECSLYEAPQSGQAGGRGNNTGISHRNHDGGGGAGLYDGSAVKEGSLRRAIPVEDRTDFRIPWNVQLMVHSRGLGRRLGGH